VPLPDHPDIAPPSEPVRQPPRYARHPGGNAVLQGCGLSDHAGAHFDPETIALMDAVLDEAWASLLPHQQDKISRIALAERILNAAARGERDPKRLCAFALNDWR
jgi:hypothetical protein